jgi:hypothetical protein
MAKLLVLLSLLIGLSGCTATNIAPAQSALLTEVNPDVIATLQRAILNAKGGRLVTLTNTVFTKRSELLIDHGTHLGPNGMPIMGAHNIKSEKFILQIVGEQCVLYYPKKELTINLEDVSCKAQ